MIFTITLLTFLTFVGGLLSNVFDFKSSTLRYPLIFAGSYIFGITVIHILPEIFSFNDDPMKIGLFVLIGFFFQQFLEYFSSGIEHGHIHKGHAVSATSRFSIVVALIIHSLLEGSLLTHDSPMHDRHESHSLLIGILLHKIPAAFALMATLKNGKGFSWPQWFILIVFSLASPLGLIFSGYLLEISHDSMTLLFALVSGSFLHISTTIFVESSPEHHFGFRKILISLLGAGLAILSEMVV